MMNMRVTKKRVIGIWVVVPLVVLLVVAACGSPQTAPESPISGRFRLRTANDQTDIVLFLNKDWTVEVQQQGAGETEPVTTARGTWQLDGNSGIITLTELRGQPVASPEVVRVKLQDGFIVVTAYQAGGTLYDLEEAKFSIGSGERHPLVRELHRRLAAIDYLGFEDPGDDLYTEETRKAVVRFQEAQGLVPNGVVDEITWVRLGNPPPPVAAPTPWPTPVPEAPPAGEPPAVGERATHTEDGKPILYLTFDDGPSSYTQQVLDLLAQYNAEATFFVLGQSVQGNPDAVRAEITAGNLIGNHTTSHVSVDGLSPDQFMQEIKNVEQVVVAAAGDLIATDPRYAAGSRYMRPPYGATDSNTLSYATSLGYAVVLWDIDPQDWRRPGADVIASHIVSSAYPGAIVLMHDGGGDRTQTVAALGMVLSQLSQQGYAFRTIYVGP